MVSFNVAAVRQQIEQKEGANEAGLPKGLSMGVLVEQYAGLTSKDERSSSPSVKRGQFVLTESEQDLLYGGDQRLFDQSSWTHTSSASLRSIHGPQAGFPGGGFNPNQLGQTLRASQGGRPGRAGERSPERRSEGHDKPWPPHRFPIKYNGDRLCNQVITGRYSRKAGAQENNKNIAGWKLSAEISPRVYTQTALPGSNRSPRSPRQHGRPSKQERLHSAPGMARGSAALVFGASGSTTWPRPPSQARPFSPRQLRLGFVRKTRGILFCQLLLT